MSRDSFKTVGQVITWWIGRIEQNDPYFRKLSSAWSDILREAFGKIEEFEI